MMCLLVVLLAGAGAHAGDSSARAPVVRPIAKTEEGGQRWALVIGINDYVNVDKLHFAQQDAAALAETLIQYCGFPADNVVLVTDKADPRSARYPTLGNLRTRIRQAAMQARKNDVLVVAFSGHGLNIDGQGYLVPIDGSENDAESLVPLSWVRKTIETSAASQRLLILDACHAAARAGAGSDSPAAAILSPLRDAAFLILASCDSDQLSHERSDVGHGVFTHALLEGLEGAADATAEGNRDNVITAMELFHFADLRVRQWGLKSGLTQTPVLEGRVKGRVELARFEPGEEPLSPAPTPKRKPSAPSSPLAPVRANYTEKAGGADIEMIWIAGGTFVMGTDTEDEDARPSHPVTVGDFWMSRTEITQRQWTAFMSDNPSSQKGDALPVDCAAWEGARQFCEKLSQAAAGRTYALSKEAQWEYACRGGTKERFFFEGGVGSIDKYVWFNRNSRMTLHAAGSLQANPFGLHDMLGNVWEWCEDLYQPYPGYRGTPFGTAGERVLRGGAYFSNSQILSVYGRSGGDPRAAERGVGFRIVCNP